MIRSIAIKGTAEGVELILDGIKVRTFNRSSAINALDFYNALDFHAGDVYEIRECTCGAMQAGPFDSFKKLVEEIVSGINKLTTEDGPAAGDELSEVSYPNTIDAMQDLDDIPF